VAGYQRPVAPAMDRNRCSARARTIEGNSHRATAEDTYRDIRQAVSALCAEFPADITAASIRSAGYPNEFVEALTKAGWMAALIPEAYGGARSRLTEASSSWKRSTGPAAIPAPAMARCTI